MPGFVSKSKKLLPLVLFIALVSILDRCLWKANKGFCLHIIEAPIPSLPEHNPPMTFPKEIFSKPFYYLGKGAQSFVFESEDRQTVIKFYRYPSHLRRFPWTHHPLGYLMSTSRRAVKEYNLKRLQLSFHSFFLAAQLLPKETALLYVHLRPTSHLHQKAHLIDSLGSHYNLPLDSIAFIVQKKAVSFLPAFKKALSLEKHDTCKHMIRELIHMIEKRCRHNLTDLDNMDNDNYGWLEESAIHIDIGRFQEKEGLNVQEEILRVTHPLITYLAAHSSELHAYFHEQIELL